MRHWLRGLPAVRLSERLAVVADESSIDFRHFRLVGTRDYGLPPDKCIDVQEDGVTLTVDLARSDLLVETELERFAEELDSAGANGRRQFRLTPATLKDAREGGLSLRSLEDWFLQCTGQPITPAVRLLLVGNLVPPLELRAATGPARRARPKWPTAFASGRTPGNSSRLAWGRPLWPLWRNTWRSWRPRSGPWG